MGGDNPRKARQDDRPFRARGPSSALLAAMDALAALIADGRAKRASGPRRGVTGASGGAAKGADAGRKRPREDAGDSALRQRRKAEDAAVAASGVPEAAANAGESSKTSPESKQVSAGSSAVPKASSAAEEETDLTLEEIVRRLRARGEPVTLFGENFAERLKRLRMLEQQNLGADELKGMKLSREEAGDEEDGKVREERKLSDDDVVNKKTPEKRILAFLKLTLGDWERAVDAMDPAQRRMTAGRQEVQTLKQTKDHLRPLKKLLKNKQVAPEVLESVDQMIQLCMKREYTQVS